MKTPSKKQKYLSILFTLFWLTLASSLFSATYHVDNINGSDSTGDGSAIAPYKTLSSINSLLTSGDNVILYDGNYGDFVYNATSNIFTDWVTFSAATGSSPQLNKVQIIGAPGSNHEGTFDAYITLSGIHILGIGVTESVELRGLRHFVIEDCFIEIEGPWDGSIENIEKTAIYLRGGDNITIQDNEITRTGSGIQARAHHVNILRNHIHDITHDGIRSIGLWDSLVEGNVIHGLDDGINDGDADWDRHCDAIHIFIMGGNSVELLQANQNVIYRGNLFYNLEAQAIQFNNYGSFPEIRNNHLTFENNIFGPVNNPNAFNNADRVDTLIFRNNSFINIPGGITYTSPYNTSGRTITSSNTGIAFLPSTTDLQVYNNIMTHSWNWPVSTATVFDYNVIQDFKQGAATGGPNTTVVSTVQYVNPTLLDGELFNDSPAINAAAPSLPIHSTDFHGNPRGANPDIGATELIGTGIPGAVDLTAPQILSLNDTNKPNFIKVVFDEFIDETTAKDTTNYSIDQNITITSAQLMENGFTVKLFTSNLSEGNTYTLTVDGVEDLHDNAISNASETFEYICETIATASGTDGGNVAENTLDGDFNTRWSFPGIGNAYLTHSFCGNAIIESVDIAFLNGSTRVSYFTIEVSSDEENWIEVYSGESSGTSNALENFDFADIIGGYVRIIGFGNSVNAWNSYTEVSVNTSPLTQSNELAGHWGFDNNPTDSSNNGNHATLVNGATYSSEHVENSHSLDVTGASSYAEIPNSGSLAITGDITLATFIKPNAIGIAGNIIAKSFNDGYRLVVNANNNLSLVLGIPNSGPHVVKVVNSSITVSLGTWQHIATTVSFSGNSGTVRFYSDGVLQSTHTITSIGGIENGSGPLYIGVSGNTTPQAFNGLIDDVRIYNTALSDVEIESLSELNNAPVLTGIGMQNVNEASMLNINVSASDSDGDPITLSASGLPAFASFTDNGNSTGTLSLSPLIGDAGTYSNITISASDGLVSDSETISITVNAVDTSLVGQWSFDNHSLDSSIYNNDATLYANAGYSTTSAENTHSLELNGTTDYVEVPNSSSLTVTGDLSLAAYIYPDVGGINANVIAKSFNDGYRLVVNSNNNLSLILGLPNSGPHVVKIVNSSATVTPGIWQHVAVTVTFNGNNGTVRFYLDGTLASTHTITSISGIENGSAPLYIGAIGNTASQAFDGLIDDVRIYNRALSDSEISAL